MKLSASGLYRVTDELGRIWKDAAMANLDRRVQTDSLRIVSNPSLSTRRYVTKSTSLRNESKTRHAITGIMTSDASSRKSSTAVEPAEWEGKARDSPARRNMC
jgi:hypothetical protein